MKKNILFCVFTLMVATFGLVTSPTTFLNPISNRQVEATGTVSYGSTGGYVWELQGRLKFLGYYHHDVDGVFGWSTYWAVRNFQYEFGLPIDGVAGPTTKDKLWGATKNWPGAAGGTTAGGATGGGATGGGAGGGGGAAAAPAPATAAVTNYVPHGFSANDIRLMANAVYGESRGEPYVGQVAVAAVILNRVNSASFPNTPSGVIFQPGAFTAVSDGQIWLEPNATAKRAVQDAINGWDPTGGAIYYFNPDTATSPWIWSRPQIKKIGKHIFCR